MTEVLCIYHANCDDGFGAAWAIRTALLPQYGDKLSFHAAAYGSAPPDVRGKRVIIADFSYPRAIIDRMGEEAAGVLILDHHKTAAAELAGLPGLPAPHPDYPEARGWLPTSGVTAVFDMSRSGAGLAWDHFCDGPRIRFIDYLEDRDLWTKKLPGVDEFTAALRSYPQTFEQWDKLAEHMSNLIDEGHAIQRYYRKLVEDQKRAAHFIEIDGHRVPAVNGSLFMASELAGELSEGYPFAVMYQTAYEPEKNQIIETYSLRSRAPDGADVSEIAKKFGGGGHKHAAGFKMHLCNGNVFKVGEER